MVPLAGTEIIPGYRCILEGIQADQEYCKLVFGLTQYYNKKLCCHLCPVIAWTSTNPVAGEPNHPNDLYTNFAADENLKSLVTLCYFQTLFQFVFVRIFVLKCYCSSFLLRREIFVQHRTCGICKGLMPWTPSFATMDKQL